MAKKTNAAAPDADPVADIPKTESAPGADPVAQNASLSQCNAHLFAMLLGNNGAPKQ